MSLNCSLAPFWFYFINSFFLGLECATHCLELNPRSSDAHKWYAICIGGRSQFQGTKDKLKDGIEFRKHVEEALNLKPDDPTLHHLLGRFKYEVSWIGRIF